MQKANTTFPSHDTDIVEQRVRMKRTDLMFESAPVAVLTLLVVGAVYAWVQRNHVDWHLLAGWYGLLSVSALARALVIRGYQRDPNPAASLSKWIRRFRVAVFFSSAIVGSVTALFWNGQMDGYQAFTLSLLIGISAGALVTLHDFVSLAIYVVNLMGPMAVQSLLAGGELQIGIGLLVIILMFIFVRFGATFSRTLSSSLRLRYENEKLLQDLEQEKNRLDNRLGRILNDSSNEIYVVEAGSLRFIQVNRRALEHLGYSEQELLGKRLPDILDQHSEREVQQLLQPIRRGARDFVFHRGAHRCRSGETYPVEMRFQLSRQEEPPIIVVTALDITERHQYEQKLRRQANIDQLTGLPNRHFMISHIREGLARSRRSGKYAALLFLDLDNFKSINDSLGHRAGDELLKQAANRIRKVLRESDTPARLGGDEFLVLLEELATPDQAGVVAEKLVKAFSKLFAVGEREIHTTTSVGISIFPGDGDNVESLMQSADTAMYEAKRQGRSGYQFFSREMRNDAEERVEIASHLSRALANHEISVVYQPIMRIDGHGHHVAGAEALVRWKSPVLGQVPPNKFIPIAESAGLIQEIGQFVLETACREAVTWPETPNGRRFVSVNASSRQFRNGNLLACVDEALEVSGLEPATLKLEITESLLIQDSQDPLNILDALRQRGIQLALDDFGTGYSSLSYLKKFPLQVLKIDRSFINDIGHDRSDEALVSAIIAMGDSLGLDIVAEGVEDETQLAFLRQRGVDLIQGYYFSPPVSAEAFRELMAQDHFQPELSVVSR